MGPAFFDLPSIDKNHGRYTDSEEKTDLLHKDRMKWRTIEKSESCKSYKIKYNLSTSNDKMHKTKSVPATISFDKTFDCYLASIIFFFLKFLKIGAVAGKLHEIKGETFQ